MNRIKDLRDMGFKIKDSLKKNWESAQSCRKDDGIDISFILREKSAHIDVESMGRFPKSILARLDLWHGTSSEFGKPNSGWGACERTGVEDLDFVESQISDTILDLESRPFFSMTPLLCNKIMVIFKVPIVGAKKHRKKNTAPAENPITWERCVPNIVLNGFNRAYSGRRHGAQLVVSGSHSVIRWRWLFKWESVVQVASD